MIAEPVRPDLVTGQPRPAPAPRQEASRTVEGSPRPFPIRVPPEMGPALERHRQSRRWAWSTSAIMAVFTVVLFTVRGGGFGWASTWWLWLFVAMWPLIFVLYRPAPIAAGARWLQSGRNWVDLWDLERIDLTAASAGKRVLELDDRDGRRVGASLLELQANPGLWDLVHNGMRLSVRARATVTDRARRELDLP